MSFFFANFIDDQSNTTERNQPMQSEQQPETATLVFLQTVSAAVTQLKQKLQQDYERVYPDLRDIMRLDQIGKKQVRKQR